MTKLEIGGRAGGIVGGVVSKYWEMLGVMHRMPMLQAKRHCSAALLVDETLQILQIVAGGADNRCRPHSKHKGAMRSNLPAWHHTDAAVQMQKPAQSTFI